MPESLSPNPNGAPTKKDEQTVKKLLMAFTAGMSNEDAAAYAGITRPTLWTWLKDDQKLSNEVENAKVQAKLLAHTMVIKDAKAGNVGSARYLMSFFQRERAMERGFASLTPGNPGNGGMQLDQLMSDKQKRRVAEQYLLSHPKEEDIVEGQVTTQPSELQPA